MSILHTFDPSGEAVISPGDVVSPVPGFPKTVIATFSPKFLRILEAMTALEEIASTNAGGRDIPIWKFAFEGAELGIYHTLLGGAGSAALLEEVLAMGAKRVLFFGSSGALDRNLIGGRLVIPTAAYRDEGVSYHYLPAGDYVRIPTAGRLAEILDSLSVPYVKAKTWTTDAFYRETRAGMLARRAEGCAVVEMECASVMAVGQFRGAEVYQFLYAADCIDADSWDKRILGRMPEDTRARILAVALSAAKRLDADESSAENHPAL